MTQEGHSPALIFHSPEPGWYFLQVTGHCFTNPESILNMHES